MCSKFKWILVLATGLFAVSTAFSQNDTKPFSSASLGVKVSTLGIGLEAATPLHNLLTLRFGVTSTGGISFRERNFSPPEGDDFIESFGYMPDWRFKPRISFTHANLLLDYHPAGVFHFTAGVFMGGSKLKLDGYLVDPDHDNQLSKPLEGKSWPVLTVGDQQVKFPGGQADLELQLGKNALKPYLGLGFGYAVPKSKVSFKFELGVLYQKGYTLRQNGKVFDLKPAEEQEFKDMHNTITKYAMVWPMVSLQLFYRIF